MFGKTLVPDNFADCTMPNAADIAGKWNERFSRLNTAGSRRQREISQLKIHVCENLFKLTNRL